MSKTPLCKLCGEPMPAGEEMFKYHGYSGPCPKPPLPHTSHETLRNKVAEIIWRDMEAQPDGFEKALKTADKILAIYEMEKSHQVIANELSKLEGAE